MKRKLAATALVLVAALATSTCTQASDAIPAAGRERVVYYLTAIEATGDGIDQIFKDSLSDLSTIHGVVWWNVFGTLLAAESALANFEDGNFADAAATLAKMVADQLIPQTPASSALAGANAVAGLAALPIKLSLNKLVKQVNSNAFKLQVVLYEAARERGLSHQQIVMRQAPLQSPDILYDSSSGYLLSVGELGHKPYGAQIPMSALVSREEVYELIRIAYEAEDRAKEVRRERDQAVREFLDYVSTRKLNTFDGDWDTLFFDDFNDDSIDPNNWVLVQGSNVLEQEQILKVETNVTDSGGLIRSQWVDIDPTRPLMISRRVKAHYGNDKYRGWLSIEVDGAPSSTFGVSYGHLRYDAGIYCSVDGFFVFRNDHHGEQCTHQPDLSRRIAPVWDQWFDEKVVYDPQSGILEYYVNNQLRTSFDVGALPSLASNRIRLSASAWGWWTGHYHYIDDLVIGQ